uniref:Fatty acyl-CoA reductase n=1 Tax=Timema poppense TaxID=170557 RepID=A0A7R9GUD2_TIMPO|nr:unnamed protein product [Timema poppensis]
MEELPTIPQFFAGRHVFVTGASGFMGKVLVEKLLRSCPEIAKIYMLMRAKRGKSPLDRLQTITNMELFDRLKQEQPHALEKLVVVTGDAIKPGLGLLADDRRILEERVSIIFHVAASVRFDDSITYAVNMNVRGTQEVAKLALKMKNLVVLLHVSTTYCNTDRKVIDEVIYPPHGDWKKSIEMVEKIDEAVLRLITPKILGGLPNTYTYTKSLAEHLIEDYSERIPAVIFRPSIVISTLDEPIKGWIDNFNGPVGLMVAGGKGIVHCFLADEDITSDYVPVDIAIKSMITAAWYKGSQRSTSQEVDVYNCSTTEVRTLSLGELLSRAYSFAMEIPVDKPLWYPSGFVTKYNSVFQIGVIFLHLLPAIIFDTVLKIDGQKPLLINIHRRIYVANLALKYFMLNQWRFLNRRFMSLSTFLHQSDVEAFSIDIETPDLTDYFRICLIGGKKYLFKEDLSNIPKARKNIYRLYVLDRIVRVLFFILITLYVVLPFWNAALRQWLKFQDTFFSS